MSSATVPEAAPGRRDSGEHERRLAVGTLAQQLSHVVSTLTMLVVVTALARTLSLAEFGTWGLLVSLSTYLLLAQGSVESAAIKAIAEATDQRTRNRAFSTASFLYVVFGLAVGGLIAGGGIALLSLLEIPDRLQDEARLGLIALGVLTFVGWPLKAFQDVLRGSQLFVLSASAEIVAYLVFGFAMLLLLVGDASLWMLIGLGGALPLLIGITSAVIVAFKRLPYRYRQSTIDSDSLRAFLSLSSYLFVVGLADLVIYALDRVILGAFRSAATVGLYEGPARSHNLVRMLHGTLVMTVLPAASRYLAQGDTQRVRDLLLRGTRYTLAATLPVTIALMVLAEPILEVWLGEKFAVAGTAMTILVAYWVFGGSTGVAGAMLVAAGRARQLARYAWLVAASNLGLSLALTPILGLEGVVLGTTIPYVLLFPIFVSLTLSALPVKLNELVREAWLPAYATGAALAAALVALRLLVPLDTVPAVLAAGAGSVLAYWAVFYALWFRPGERALVKNIVHDLAPWR